MASTPAPLFDREDLDRVAAAIAEAERTTAGEIRVVIQTRPLVRHGFYSLLWAALAALVAPWALVMVISLRPIEMLAIQAVVFVIVGALLSLPPLVPRVVPPIARRAAARAAALDQFLAHGVHQTRARTGILIFVAVPDHRVEVVADEGIHAHVGEAAWGAVCETVLAGARAGRLGDGLCDGVAAAGAVLAAHVPRHPDDTNELSDRLVVM
ncbi:TPM domain-containing protein [Ancylobacter terrae]|uniref:TPM domain-containing protein n=1 Tax=Ancylobacter sp. sgz301288 TaxID=3342077 RepID=UPI00385A6B42